jgi:FkbM family methyltransferase
MLLWRYFNFTFSKKVNDTKVKLPVCGSVGLTNTVLRQDWLDLLIEKYAFKDNLSTFVDVGVNVGQTLLRLKTIYPEMDYLGFEPNSTCTAYVQKLIKINKFRNCTVQNVALSTEIGILQLEKNNDTDSAASVIHNLRPNYFSTKENVLALDYQSFYLDKAISFIKIDVEGAEYEVLKGMEKAIEKYQPIIICEVLDSYSANVLEFTQERAAKLCKMLKSWNYNIIRLQTKASDIVNYEKIETIKITQWTLSSREFNDYLFYPTSEENDVIGKLKMIMKN